MPNAIQEMSKAAKDAGLTMNGTVKEMLALQATGGLISSKILPHFAKRLSDAARNNGGLEKALLSNRVAMNRFIFAFQEAADIFFKSGFSEGLTDFFNTTASSVRTLAPLWRGLGKIIGSVLKVLSYGVRAVTPVLELFGIVLDQVTSLLGDFSFLVGTAFSAAVIGKVMGTATAFSFLSKTLRLLIVRMGYFLAIASAVDEALNLFQKDRDGVLFSVTEQKARDSRQRSGTLTEGDQFMNAIGNITNASFWKNQYPFKLFSDSSTNGSATNKTNSTINVSLNVDGNEMAAATLNTAQAESIMYNNFANAAGM